MRILLVNPPCDPRTIGLRYIAKIEPLGLELIGASVSESHDVRLVDMEVAPGDLERTLAQFAPDIVGVTSEIVHVAPALEVLRRVRARYPRCLTVVGGHHPTMKPEDFAEPATVDLIVLGEGVETFREVCAARESGATDYRHIAGLAVPVSAGTVERTETRPFPTSLDDHPLPDRRLTQQYRKRYFYLFENSVAAVRTSVGCPHHCIFCSVRVYAEGCFVPRSAELVFDEIIGLDEEFIMFCDDHSFADPERMRKLATMLLESGVKKRYFAYSRADTIVAHRDVFELWAKAGLMLVMIGLEALEDKALKRSGKQTPASVNEEAVQIAEELGFGISAGFLVEPDFEREDFERIDRYVRKRPSIWLTEYTALTPFPGTPLYKKERDRLLTHDPAMYDLQHFLLPTKLTSRELYRLLLKYYLRSTFRVIKRLARTRPGTLASPHTARLLWGLRKNAKALKRAHRDIPESQGLTTTTTSATKTAAL